MTRQCALTEKRSSPGRKYVTRGIAKKKKGIGLNITGKTKRRFNPNLQTKKLWYPEENRFVTLRLSTAALRTVNKKGVHAVVSAIKKKAAC